VGMEREDGREREREWEEDEVTRQREM
jgi:hypothetical protein